MIKSLLEQYLVHWEMIKEKLNEEFAKNKNPNLIGLQNKYKLEL